MRAILAALILCTCATVTLARDRGQYAQMDPARKKWFEEDLKSKGGDRCCADADGTGVIKTDWDIHTDEKGESFYRGADQRAMAAGRFVGCSLSRPHHRPRGQRYITSNLDCCCRRKIA
jgi:hypothetical protein